MPLVACPVLPLRASRVETCHQFGRVHAERGCEADPGDQGWADGSRFDFADAKQGGQV